MEFNCQLRTPAALPLKKDPRYPLDTRLEPVWTLWRNDDNDDKEEQHSLFHIELVTQLNSLWRTT
jgi:hypothetical protein